MVRRFASPDIRYLSTGASLLVLLCYHEAE